MVGGPQLLAGGALAQGVNHDSLFGHMVSPSSERKLAGVDGSRTHLPMDHIGTTVLKTARPTGTLPLPRPVAVYSVGNPRPPVKWGRRSGRELIAQVVLRRDRRRGAVTGRAHDLAGGGGARGAGAGQPPPPPP